MKLMIASDIHGSAHFCKQLVDRFHDENPTKLVILGDVLYHGPRNPLPMDYNPQKVAELLNTIADRIIWVKGNCDADIDQMLLHFPVVENAMLFACDKTIFCSHGHVHSKSNPPALASGDVLVNGHFHVPTVETFGNNNLYVNCGSVSIPKEQSPHSYLVLQDGLFTWKDLEGTPYKTYKM